MKNVIILNINLTIKSCNLTKHISRLVPNLAIDNGLIFKINGRWLQFLPPVANVFPVLLNTISFVAVTIAVKMALVTSLGMPFKTSCLSNSLVSITSGFFLQNPVHNFITTHPQKNLFKEIMLF